jgi:hypothetical protein
MSEMPVVDNLIGTHMDSDRACMDKPSCEA